MLKSNKCRIAFILSVFSAICLLGAGCKQHVDEVPALNKEPAAPDALVPTDGENTAKANAEAAEEAKIAAEAKAAEEANMAAEDAKIAAEEAKIAAAEAKAAEEMKAAEAAKVAAEAKAAEEVKAAGAAKVAASDAKPVEVAPTEEPTHPAPMTQQAAVPVTAEVADDSSCEDTVCPDSAKACVDSVSGTAALLASRLVDVELPVHFGARHGRLVVQVNRAVNRSSLSVDRSEVLRVMQDSVDLKHDENVVSSHAIRGDMKVGGIRAIHLLFDVESKALGLISGNKLADAPSVIVNTLIENSDNGPRLKVSATDVHTGKVFWTDTKAVR